MTFKLRAVVSVLLSAAVLVLAGAVAASADNMLGDVDGDSEVTVIDASCIQRRLAGLRLDCSFSEYAADADGNGVIEITDATFILRCEAGMDTPYQIGVRPTEAPTQRPTQAPTQRPTELPTQRPTDDEGWGRDIFRP